MEDGGRQYTTERDDESYKVISFAARITIITACAIAAAFFAVLTVISFLFLFKAGYYEKVGVSSPFFVFLNTPLGAVVSLFCLALIVAVAILFIYIAKAGDKRAAEYAALKKCEQTLSGVNLRYDNVNEITVVMDVLETVTSKPIGKAERKAAKVRLDEFCKASNYELPKNPETAAILDSLPAPDTPESLAAALSSGATLRQAEDGQTLIMTTLSGDKHILLTPVQTADGVILCRQGVRIKTDIAPNIEEIGITSIPTAPAFFEGQPLEKNIEYPELPQPGVALGPAELLNSGAASDMLELLSGAELSAPMPAARIGGTTPLAIAGGRISEIPESRPPDSRTSRAAYAEYRGLSARLEIEQTEELSSLLAEVKPLSAEEQRKVDEYRASIVKPRPIKKSPTPEQTEKRKKDAAMRKIAKDAFLNALTPEDRELYLSEQKLAKSRAAAIRKLRRIAADRKLLDKLDDHNK